MGDHRDRDLGNRLRDAWHAEEKPLTVRERVAFDTALYERIEARLRTRPWGLALAVPVIAAIVAVAVAYSTDGPAPQAPDPWATLAAAQTTWDAICDDNRTETTVAWLASANSEVDLSELLSPDYRLMAAWLETTTLPTAPMVTSGGEKPATQEN